ncbi:MAG: glycosyltransferase family 2 protein [Proteobacteria bacterium]|nr:glycosyltransferase family 2 protein [Pseudomonadota bacterium]
MDESQPHSSSDAFSSVCYVVPCYNEEESVGEFYQRARAVADKQKNYAFEFIFVNDGSSDNTPGILNALAARDGRVKVVHLARNMGHQIAATAGLDFANSDVVAVIDSDLQDPPELIEKMLPHLESGYDIVHAQRTRRSGDSWFKKVTAKFFYKIMRWLATDELIENSGDFRAFTRPVLEASRGFREPHRFLRGLFATIGFKQHVIQYTREPRFGGKTKYPLLKMLKLAFTAIISFSSTPIRVITWLAFILWGGSLVYLSRALYAHFILDQTQPGWTSIIFLLSVYTGILLFCQGILGAYISRIFEQGQNRPLYWLSDLRNINIDQVSGQRSRFLEMRLSENILRSALKRDQSDDKKAP